MDGSGSPKKYQKLLQCDRISEDIVLRCAIATVNVVRWTDCETVLVHEFRLNKTLAYIE